MTQEPHCPICLRDMIPALDDSSNGEPECKCAQCRAEEEHDFDAEPLAKFRRSGARVEETP